MSLWSPDKTSNSFRSLMRSSINKIHDLSSTWKGIENLSYRLVQHAACQWIKQVHPKICPLTDGGRLHRSQLCWSAHSLTKKSINRPRLNRVVQSGWREFFISLRSTNARTLRTSKPSVWNYQLPQSYIIISSIKHSLVLFKA